jgi:hypothetical protein
MSACRRRRKEPEPLPAVRTLQLPREDLSKRPRSHQARPAEGVGRRRARRALPTTKRPFPRARRRRPRLPRSGALSRAPPRAAPTTRLHLVWRGQADAGTADRTARVSAGVQSSRRSPLGCGERRLPRNQRPRAGLAHRTRRQQADDDDPVPTYAAELRPFRYGVASARPNPRLWRCSADLRRPSPGHAERPSRAARWTVAVRRSEPPDEPARYKVDETAWHNKSLPYRSNAYGRRRRRSDIRPSGALV